MSSATSRPVSAEDGEAGVQRGDLALRVADHRLDLALDGGLSPARTAAVSAWLRCERSSASWCSTPAAVACCSDERAAQLGDLGGRSDGGERLAQAGELGRRRLVAGDRLAQARRGRR